MSVKCPRCGHAINYNNPDHSGPWYCDKCCAAWRIETRNGIVHVFTWSFRT